MTIKFNCYFDKKWLFRHKETNQLGLFATDDELITACLNDAQNTAIQQYTSYSHEDNPILLNALGKKEPIENWWTDTKIKLLAFEELKDYIQLTEDEQDDFDEIELYDVFIGIED